MAKIVEKPCQWLVGQHKNAVDKIINQAKILHLILFVFAYCFKHRLLSLTLTQQISHNVEQNRKKTR